MKWGKRFFLGGVAALLLAVCYRPTLADDVFCSYYDFPLALFALLLMGLGMRNKLFRSSGRLFLPTLLFMALSLMPHAAFAGAGPGWFNVQGAPVTPEEAAAFYQGVAAEQKITIQSAAATQPTAEIVELARALQHDSKLIYEYVHNHVGYTPYFGSLKGATLTYLDGDGNDFDQAALLIALLRESGYTAQFVYGQMWIPAYGAGDLKDMRHWLSVDANNSVISTVLANGGIPALLSGSDWRVDRVWVQTTINSTTYLLDPAFKSYQETSGIDIKSAMGYNRTTFLQVAGGTVGTDFVQNINEAGLQTQLNDYTLNLADYIRANYPNAGMKEIVGSREIVPEYPAQLPTTLPFVNTPQYTWIDIPDTYAHKIRIVHGGIDKTFNIADLSGKRLSLTYRAGGTLAPAAAALSVAGESVLALADSPAVQSVIVKPTAAPSDAAVNSILPNKSVAVPSVNADSAGTIQPLGTVSTDFGKIYPPEAGTSSSTVTWGPMVNTNSVTVQVVVSLPGNPSGAYFITTGSGITNLAPGQSMNAIVKFANTGQTPGTKTGQMRIQWVYNGSTFSDNYYNLTGIVAHPLTLSGSVTSVSTFLNQPYTLTCRLQNNGTLPLSISSTMTLTGADASRFQLVSGYGVGTIAAGGYCDIQVKYLANAHGIHKAHINMSFTYDGLSYGSSDILPLQGQTYYKPDLTGSYGKNFGQGYLNDYKDSTVRLINNGTLSLTINTTSLTGTDAARFQITGGSGSGAVNPGQYRDISIRYLADATGLHTADVHLTYTYDSLASQIINLPLSGETLATPIAQLWLDDQLVAEETDPVSGTNLDILTLSVDHPYSGGNGTFADQSVDYHLKRGGSTYAIIYDFGDSRDGRLLEKRQRRMQAYRTAGLADSSREVLSETLNVIGMTWMRDTTLNDALLAQLSGVLAINHHRFGIVAQETGYYIDVKAQLASTVSRHGDDAALDAFFKATNHLDSALEHGVLEQMQINRPSVSTVKLMALNNAAGAKTFQVTSANYAAVEPLLTGYSDSDKQSFQTSVNNGHTLILPENGQITLRQWVGKGYIDYDLNSAAQYVGMVIGGDYYGGYGAIAATLSIDPVLAETYVQTQPKVTTPKIPSKDPVDMVSGAFLYNNADLTISGKAGGLALKRSYNSNNNTIDSVLSYGWSYNYNLYAEVNSSSEFGLGLRLPVDAAAMMSADTALLDLMSGTADLKSWTVAALTGKWGMDQLIRNAVSLHLKNDVLTYIKLPGGSFSMPPGVTSELMDNNGLFSIRERFGRSIDFNADNKADQITDADGNRIVFTYTGGLLQSVADDFNHSLSFTYIGGQLTSAADSAGRSVSFGYDTNNDLTSCTDPEAKVWIYGYDANHRLTTLTNPSGITTVINTYDTLGRVMSQEVPRQSGTVSYNLYFSGFRNVEEDGSGSRTVYHFDDRKQLISVQDALGNVTEKLYDGQNHLTEVIDPRGSITRYQYDGNNNLTKITDAYNKASVNTYDALFHLTDVTDPMGHVTHTDYDAEHHPVKTTVWPAPGSPIATESAYYANGLTQTAKDGRNVVTSFTYDAYGNPAATQTGTHPAVTYQYNAIGLMSSLIDQAGAHTSFTYDNRGLLLSRIDPLGKTASITHYNDGKVHTKTDRQGQTITYTYTGSGKLSTITYPDNSVTSNNYDLRDNLTQRQDSCGTTSYSYDAVNRVTALTAANGFTTGYEYDAAGNMTRITYPGNKTVSYTYDAVNRLATVTIDWLSRTASYSYDDAGRLLGLDQFNGTTSRYTYDDANRLTDLADLTAPVGNTIADYHFTLDANGSRIHSTQTTPLPTAVNNGSVAMTYNAAQNRLLTADSVNFTYDNEGQLASEDTNSFTFDYEHRLIGINGSVNEQFRYDGAGNRLEVTRNGTITSYIYDMNGNLIAEADANNVIIRYYIYGKGLMAMATSNGGLYCYHFDATGHTIALTDAGKSIVNKYTYTPFGIIAGEAETMPQPFKYAGQYGVMAEPDGLYYMRARYYDPQVGRFISEDPKGFDGGDLNLYAYVGNNPMLFVDPLGLDRISNTLGIGSFIVNTTAMAVPVLKPVGLALSMASAGYAVYQHETNQISESQRNITLASAAGDFVGFGASKFLKVGNIIDVAVGGVTRGIGTPLTIAGIVQDSQKPSIGNSSPGK